MGQYRKVARTWADRFGSSRRLALVSVCTLVAFLPVCIERSPALSGGPPHQLPRPLPPLAGAEHVLRADWNVIPNPCVGMAPTDALHALQQRYLCDRQRYFERGRRQHLNPTAERWPKLNPDLNLTVDYDRYLVSGPGLGVTFDDDRIAAGHLRLPADLPQTAASAGRRHPCAVGAVCMFQIRSLDGAGQAVDHNSARFKARLYGPAIVDADVVSAGAGLYNVSYRPYDAGQYLVQVLLTSVEGEGDAPEYVNRHVPFLVNDLVYQSEHLLEVTVTDAVEDVPFCRSADQQLGRWVYLDGGVCRAPYCTAAPGVTLTDLQITDPLGLNADYVWAPADCRYHLYSPLEFYQCSAQCGYARYALSGDSLGRELLQNLQMLLTDFAPAFAMPKLKLGGPNWTNAIRFRDHGNFTIAFSMNDHDVADDVAVLHLANAHLLTTGLGVSALLGDALAAMDAFARRCAANPRQRCLYFVNPAVQREADHSNEERLRRSFYRDVTRDRMRALNAALRRHAVELGLAILEGEVPTRARWTACWDGIHYSEMFDHYASGDPRWFGGASTMLSQALINALCNQPCNGVRD